VTARRILADAPDEKPVWMETQARFRKLLAWLDQGRDSGGETYLEMRRRLVSYFGRKRCPAADDLADETLKRISRRLDEQGDIAESIPARYCYITARFVFLEHLRDPGRNHASLEEATHFNRGATSSSEQEDATLDRLDRCLQQLDPADRELILEYYRGDQRDRITHRRQLAARLGMTANALTIRACRIRGRLEDCVALHERHDATR
jgi:DNA-directed RNA polymerase specialized sigma24 family protein